MSRLSATTALGPPGPRSLAIVLKRCVRSAISVFMVQQGRADYHQAKDPDPPIVCFLRAKLQFATHTVCG
jgi:hypothetical protein